MHTMMTRVTWAEVDSAGVMFCARALEYAHRAFEEVWRSAFGLPYRDIIENRRIGFPAVRSSGTHHSPLYFDDNAAVTIMISEFGNRSLTWNVTIENDGGVCWSGEVKTACVDIDKFESIEIPDDIRDGLNIWMQDD